jgi:ion channel-forming bestrophin family protein
MIRYNPKEWFTFIFRLHKSDTIRQLMPLLIGIAAYSAFIAVLEQEVFKLSDNSHVKNIPLMHSLMGFAISMLLVFRTNTAYDRWWEGRKLWGALVNNSRNLAIKLSAILKEDDKNNRTFFSTSIPFFAFSLKNHLQQESTKLALFDLDDHGHILEKIDQGKHIPNQVAAQLFNRVYHLHQQGKITGDELIILNEELKSFTDICGACERIKNTPIPFSYSVFIKKFIFIYVMTLPFGYVFSMGYYVIPVVTFVFYVLASLELVAEEIEDPFGSDANDLPMEKIASNIKKHVHEILH